MVCQFTQEWKQNEIGPSYFNNYLAFFSYVIWLSSSYEYIKNN